jgi:hypothetical protein
MYVLAVHLGAAQPSSSAQCVALSEGSPNGAAFVALRSCQLRIAYGIRTQTGHFLCSSAESLIDGARLNPAHRTVEKVGGNWRLAPPHEP